ncbi:MFS transporter [Brasilonema octagenarum UFV-E1]|uniref:MFS transporter n=1 Tax=Brasilonema sennae CENA114 TaxID=415709 RepID=A0A856MHS9_9CYAN|nr:MFS transporter [Brasilonema sennae]QDL10803.1 MFS transporter [Brasilonema sennae CENA114]QDL17150.1 MFS transporter [Brasilonema octagenarum UFV-E1]
MRTFIIIWLGQAVSIIGSSMTAFAFTLWVWELTGQATALALFGLFTQVPQVLITPIAGVIVDRWNRKYLMILGDTVSGLLTITVLLLYSSHNLQLWHLYLAVAVQGTFVQIQELAYLASVSMIVPKQQYSRASSIAFLANSSSDIIAPALAGVLYVVIGLAGILIIDITTFVIAVSTLVLVRIPQPTIAQAETQSHTNLKQELYFGWDYITARPSLLAMLALMSLFWFTYNLGNSLSSPLILARSGNDAKVLGIVASAAGLGGIIGALLVSTWGGFKRRIHGVLLGMVGAGLSQTVFGLGRVPLIWFPAKFCSSLNFPILGSADEAIWLRKVRPNVQGRVLSTHSLVERVASTVAYLIAGPLADYVFEPAMMSGGSLAPILGWIFGTGKGAGMAVLYVLSSLGLLLVGLSGYAFRTLRDVEIILPDHDTSAE